MISWENWSDFLVTFLMRVGIILRNLKVGTPESMQGCGFHQSPSATLNWLAAGISSLTVFSTCIMLQSSYMAGEHQHGSGAHVLSLWWAAFVAVPVCLKPVTDVCRSIRGPLMAVIHLLPPSEVVAWSGKYCLLSQVWFWGSLRHSHLEILQSFLLLSVPSAAVVLASCLLYKCWCWFSRVNWQRFLFCYIFPLAPEQSASVVSSGKGMALTSVSCSAALNWHWAGPLWAQVSLWEALCRHSSLMCACANWRWVEYSLGS